MISLDKRRILHTQELELYFKDQIMLCVYGAPCSCLEDGTES